MTDNVTRLAALLHEKWTCRGGHDRVPYGCQMLASILDAAGVTVGLDVERLARALLAWSGTSPLNPHFSITASPRDMAAAIAREYAALREGREP